MQGLVQSFLNHTDLHEKAVRSLEQIYNEVLGSAKFLNPALELRVVDALIGELYAISVSLVITGPISVGKSTIVNCIIGHDLSPHRFET